MTSGNKDVDWSKIKDLYDDDEIMEDMNKQGFETEDKPKKEDRKRVHKLRAKMQAELNDAKFTKEYFKAGGI